jgi:hypothetical protein
MRTGRSSCTRAAAGNEGFGHGCTALAQNLVGASAPFREAMELVQLYAAWTAPLLITGETGTGKALVARAVHLQSRRRRCPSILVDCATLSDTQIESALFGHTRGAFTDTSQARQRLVHLAEGGRCDRATLWFLVSKGEFRGAANTVFTIPQSTSQQRRAGASDGARCAGEQPGLPPEPRRVKTGSLTDMRPQQRTSLIKSSSRCCWRPRQTEADRHVTRGRT